VLPSYCPLSEPATFCSPHCHNTPKKCEHHYYKLTKKTMVVVVVVVLLLLLLLNRRFQY
jgi:hypothetical protein